MAQQIEAPPRTPETDDELLALIEEARRRARRRRVGYAAVIVGVLAAAGAIYVAFGGGAAGDGGATLQGGGGSRAGAAPISARPSSASRNALHPHRCPGGGLEALSLTPRAGAAARSIIARRVGPPAQIDAAIHVATPSGSVAHKCGPKIAHRTLWVQTWDHRFDHGPNQSASLAQHRLAVSRFVDGFRAWYWEH